MSKYDTVYCIVDDFCKLYDEMVRHKLLDDGAKRRRSGKLSLAEMLSIMIFYQVSDYRNFKRYYQHEIHGRLRHLFRELPSYDRFIALMPRLFMPMALMLHGMSGKKTGEYYVDSTHLAVCKNQRIGRHKTFDGLAARGKSTMGWFYGFKLHMVINMQGKIIAVRITAGNVDDRKAFEEMAMRHNLKGTCYADKGYISQTLWKRMWKQGLHLITGIRKNMTNYLIPILDKLMLRKRYIIESVFGILKEHTNINPAKHRSPTNFFVSLFAALIAYQIRPTKPSIRYP